MHGGGREKNNATSPGKRPRLCDVSTRRVVGSAHDAAVQRAYRVEAFWPPCQICQVHIVADAGARLRLGQVDVFRRRLVVVAPSRSGTWSGGPLDNSQAHLDPSLPSPSPQSPPKALLHSSSTSFHCVPVFALRRPGPRLAPGPAARIRPRRTTPEQTRRCSARKKTHTPNPVVIREKMGVGL